jgi:DNA-binding LytR/AlgR family response regulator
MGQSYPIDYTLDRLESLINPHAFFRINRKAIVSMDFIHSVEDYFNNRLKIRLTKKNEMDLVVSRNRVKPFKDWLKNA